MLVVPDANVADPLFLITNPYSNPKMFCDPAFKIFVPAVDASKVQPSTMQKVAVAGREMDVPAAPPPIKRQAVILALPTTLMSPPAAMFDVLFPSNRHPSMTSDATDVDMHVSQ